MICLQSIPGATLGLWALLTRTLSGQKKLPAGVACRKSFVVSSGMKHAAYSIRKKRGCQGTKGKNELDTIYLKYDI